MSNPYCSNYILGVAKDLQQSINNRFNFIQGTIFTSIVTMFRQGPKSYFCPTLDPRFRVCLQVFVLLELPGEDPSDIAEAGHQCKHIENIAIFF